MRRTTLAPGLARTLALGLALAPGCTSSASPPPAPLAPPRAPATPAVPAAPATPAPAPPEPPPVPVAAAPIRWIALGDSYTKGEAARPEEAWPAVAAARLRASGRSVELVRNLGRTGWTTRDVLGKQVPVLDKEKADLVTVQVGINDLVQGVSEDDFRAALRELLSVLVAKEGSTDRVVVVTIPDFSVAAMAPRFGDPARLHDDIAKRNAIIAEEAKTAGVRSASVFERSRAALADRTLLAPDGIHPSAKGYAAWVEDVLPALEASLAVIRSRP